MRIEEINSAVRNLHAVNTHPKLPEGWRICFFDFHLQPGTTLYQGWWMAYRQDKSRYRSFPVYLNDPIPSPREVVKELLEALDMAVGVVYSYED